MGILSLTKQENDFRESIITSRRDPGSPSQNTQNGFLEPKRPMRFVEVIGDLNHHHMTEFLGKFPSS